MTNSDALHTIDLSRLGDPIALIAWSRSLHDDDRAVAYRPLVSTDWDI